MKILLLGEYSNVHWTLTEGLRALGHEVCVVSNGDFWKNYPRDIDVARQSGKWGGIKLMAKVLSLLPRLRGFDVVQLINPMFFELKAERLFSIYRYLRRHNGKLILGAYGMDYYWVHECITRKPLRYSDFNIGPELRTNQEALTERQDWIGTKKAELNQLIANNCDAIVAGLYEYWTCYKPLFPQKTHFIPFPIKPLNEQPSLEVHSPLRVFIGINRERSAYKGTDIMLSAAEEVQSRHPKDMELRIAESVPFKEYREMMNGSDIILDQLYSYTPSMNPLEAMKRGLVCVGGGEPENYEILGERKLRPIVNVKPCRESVVSELESLVEHPEHVAELKRQSVEYVKRHHDYRKVAAEYLKIYEDGL